MRYVIIRDDDTNAFTPVECLERLYRPFLDKGLPVNLATIPAVSRNAKMGNGNPEGFLLPGQKATKPEENAKPAAGAENVVAGSEKVTPAATQENEPAAEIPEAHHQSPENMPIGNNAQLVSYLKANRSYRIVQHGCHHDYWEFDCAEKGAVIGRLESGTQLLQEAGFPRPQTFVAPYDKLSRVSLREVASRFRVLSTGWYELRRLPYTWWPQYGFKKLRHSPHWRVGKTLLLSHPGCLLSCHRTYSTMLGGIFHYLQTQQLTVLVTHWWEYFRNGAADEPFIDFLHETAEYIATHPELEVISFEDLANGTIQLN